MIRYYYDNPLEVAWMIQEFGMKFDHDTPVDWIDLIDNLLKAGNHAMAEHHGMKVIAIPYNPNAKFYVHPDSLHLLKTQEGDMLYGPCGGEMFHVTKTVIFNSDMSIEGAQRSIDESGWQIRMRWIWRDVGDSGPIAFHWPESEAA
jgi:hypothetical protein